MLYWRPISGNILSKFQIIYLHFKKKNIFPLYFIKAKPTIHTFTIISYNAMEHWKYDINVI